MKDFTTEWKLRAILNLSFVNPDPYHLPLRSYIVEQELKNLQSEVILEQVKGSE